jgi:hypothetical protein
MTETSAQHGARLERDYMTAIDEALDAIGAFAGAIVMEADEATIAAARERARIAWAAFGEIVINRCDHRTAHMLITQLRQVDAMMHPERTEAE